MTGAVESTPVLVRKELPAIQSKCRIIFRGAAVSMQEVDKKTVFVGSTSEGVPAARALANQLRQFADVTLWSEGAFRPGKTTLESLAEVADRSDIAIFMLTGDDSTVGPTSTRARQNIVFEVGYFAGRIGSYRTIIAGDSSQLPSDLAGVLFVPLSVRGSENLEAAVAPAAAAIRKLLSQMPPRAEKHVEFSSCFISYSWNDKDFSAQLYDDLQSVGIRCWLDFKEMRTGERMLQQVERAIQAHDKVLLVLSSRSVNSAWVRAEVANALTVERARNRTVLFPIRVDDAIFSVRGVPEIEQLKEKYILDFTNWQDRQLYQRSFSKLVRDLAISTSVESEAR